VTGWDGVVLRDHPSDQKPEIRSQRSEVRGHTSNQCSVGLLTADL
jgi:hypothetical protein